VRAVAGLRLGAFCVSLLTSASLGGCSLDREALVEDTRAGAGKSGGGSAGADAKDKADGGGTAGLDSSTTAGTAAGTGPMAGTGGGTAGVTGGPDACGGCDDGVFCNGTERCMVGDPGADARGCVTTPACLITQACDEVTNACATDCDLNGGDADGDGFVSTDCGGDDCNDAALAAYPGAVELCDGLDNDCNAAVDDNFAQFSCLRDKTFASCLAGQCLITACDTGWSDCDGNAANGCERELDPTPGDCKTTDCLATPMPNDGDTPDDDNDCTTEYCSSGSVVTDNLPNGAGCDSGNGSCVLGTCMPIEEKK
jgi:Putative metal-binding motif